ncbi:ABC transporter permease [Anoxybacteroides amylolyticum]|uniref:Bacterial ABC transporter EcsB family protein n=1 Tax=Anoxybacteroides amylolyticum TaxID=294699 RepID=A0A167TNL4_9BACL|nr:ABC transporter permease [Anoxybacillus amylolyticus]ANB61614.1 bacterial ABC transporter EcsB family protein [Anoxybacillus amylolyticus]
MNSEKLWNERFSRYVVEVRRYLRYMLNDHLLFVVLIGLSAGAVIYEKWVRELSPQFPYAIVEAFVLALFVTPSSVRTFLQEADIVFLTPAETKLRPYIQRSLLFSFAVQTLFLLVGLLVIVPLHLRFASMPLSFFSFFLWIWKGWNVWIHWRETHWVERKEIFSNIGRFLLNGVVVYLLLVDVPKFLFLILLVIVTCITIYFWNETKRKPLPWEALIWQEAQAMRRFYRLANLFTDVPHMKEKAKRRLWLDVLLRFSSDFHKEEAFRYLYVRTFSRAGDYFGIYVRLTMIGCVLIYIVPTEYGKALAACFFLYATGIQLFVLSNHHRGHVLVRLYPLPSSTRKKAVLQLLFLLLVVQNLVFVLILTIRNYWVSSAWTLGLGLCFIYWLVFGYFSNRWRGIK